MTKTKDNSKAIIGIITIYSTIIMGFMISLGV